MDTVAPEAPEPSASAEATAERAAPVRRHRKVPTSVVVTFLGIALTAWLLPAFTHQRDDRQKVRELQAQFADAIAAGTATALAKGSVAASQPSSTIGPRRKALDPIETDWEIARTRLQLKLSAYFPQSVVTAWSDFGFEVVRFLRVCRYVGVPGWNTDLGIYLGSLNLTKKQIEEPLGLPGLTISRLLSIPQYRRRGLETIRGFMLAHAARVTETMLSAHAAGYSTTKRDLVNDLLPF